MSSATAPRRRPWGQRAVVVPATLTLLACVLLGTVGWYFLAVAVGYNCGMSEASCGTASKAWLAADGVGIWLLAAAAAVLLLASRARPGWRRPAAIACWVLLPTAVGWFVLAGRLILRSAAGG